jgi:hypothetical protein
VQQKILDNNVFVEKSPQEQAGTQRSLHTNLTRQFAKQIQDPESNVTRNRFEELASATVDAPASSLQYETSF